MKSPRKYTWYPFIFSIVIAAMVFLTIARIWNTATQKTGPILGTIIFTAFAIFILYLGYSQSVNSYTFKNHKVRYPVSPFSLKVDQTYWLNGKTHAKYLGKNGPWYCFSIHDINDPRNPLDNTRLTHTEIQKYIAENEEVEMII